MNFHLKWQLLKAILGDHPPTTGIVQLNNKLRIGRFDQHHADQLDMQKTPLEMLKKIAGDGVPLSALRSHLGGMGESTKHEPAGREGLSISRGTAGDGRHESPSREGRKVPF